MQKEKNRKGELYEITLLRGAYTKTPSTAVLPVVTNNFKLKPTLISMVQQSQFGGTLMEDSNLHLSVFLEVCDMIKINGAFTDAIRLHFFSFSLKNKTRAWLHSLPLGSITIWDELMKVFLAKFFPTSKTVILRN